MDYSGRSNFLYFYWLYPSTKTAITPMSFEQIEKFQCLKSSTTQGLSHDNIRTHVARVTCPETCLKVCQLLGPKSQKRPIPSFVWAHPRTLQTISRHSTLILSMGIHFWLFGLQGSGCTGEDWIRNRSFASVGPQFFYFSVCFNVYLVLNLH